MQLSVYATRLSLLALTLALGGAPAVAQTGSGLAAGTALDHLRGQGDGSPRFLVETNQGGKAIDLHILSLRYGRLVDVYDEGTNGERSLIHKNYVIGPGLASDGVDYELEGQAVTGVERLTILHPADSPGWDAAFPALDAGLVLIQTADPTGSFLSMVPRNAAIVLRLDDQLLSASVNAETVQLYHGVPSLFPLQTRVFPDPNHGDWAIHPGDTDRTFYSTRVIIDTTTSELEALEHSPPLHVNGLGLPASNATSLSNILLRVPTHISAAAGQTQVLTTPFRRPLDVSGNGPVDLSTSTQDVLRALRSGGPTQVTGDLFNGFLPDVEQPVVLGTQVVTIVATPQQVAPGSSDYVLPQVQFLSSNCASTPSPGDVLRKVNPATQELFLVEVLDAPNPIAGTVVTNLEVRLVTGDANAWPQVAPGTARLVSPYDANVDAGQARCYVRISPQPTGFPGTPTDGASTSSSVHVEYSEAMDPGAVSAFDTLTLTRQPVPLSGTDYVVGEVLSSFDLTEHTFAPDLLLNHAQGTAEQYFFHIGSGLHAPRDLAGNSLAEILPPVRITIDPSLSSRTSGGRVTRFASIDEEPPVGPEWGGQHLYDLANELIRARPVVRYEAVADRTQAVPSLMLAFPQGVQTPLSNLGSRMQTVWRYADVGFGLQDITNFNVDVEGLSWAPVGNQIVADHYTNFEISLSHSKYQPDEYIDPSSLFPKFPNSGLKNSYANNVLDGPQQIVHPRELGYTVSPGDFYVSGTGTGLMPYPLNQTIPVSQYRTFTWRDTSKLMRGGTPAPLGSGVEIFQNLIILGIDPMNFMTAGNIETIGLPLLMDFKCFPDGDALGLNALDISLGTNSSARPNFRAFTTGGTNTGQIPISVQPDLTSVATGGYNPGSTPIAGQSTYGLDNTFYIGALDLVVRVSRSYSLWFSSMPGAVYRPTIVQPAAVDQPAGTSIELAFRGALSVANPAPLEDAGTLDAYGDYYQPPVTGPTLHNNPNPTFNFLNDSAWHDDVSDIDGVPYYQIRITFRSNAVSGEGPVLSGLGQGWQ